MLLRALCAATGGFYHQAVEGTAAEQLRDLSEDYSPFARLPAAPAFGDWRTAITALAALPTDEQPLLVALDEFSYLVSAAPELASVLQRQLDAAGHKRGRGCAWCCAARR
ncbi:MAG: hypothetical protein ACR2KP_18880 [Egibacteraceae bacterium]